MAYGTESIPAVNKIFGPGNQYVTAAKQLVQMQGGRVLGLAFAIELSFLKGRAKLPRDIDIFSVLTY